MISGKSQGSAAANLALRILSGERVESIPVINQSPNRYMFDYYELFHFQIPFRLLPPESEIVNQPYHDRVSLAGMNLRGLNLSGAHLNQSELQGSDLREANLSQAFLAQSRLDGADLSRTSLVKAYLTEVIGTGANFTYADLKGAFLRITNLTDEI